jgi:hypothetical protein
MDQEKSFQKQQISRNKRNSTVSNKIRLELVKLVMMDGELIKEVEQKLMNSTFYQILVGGSKTWYQVFHSKVNLSALQERGQTNQEI